MRSLRFGLVILVALPFAGTVTAQPGKPRVDRFGDPLPAGALFRIGTTRLQLDRQLQTIAVSPDGKLVAAASDDAVGVWEVPTGREVLRAANARNRVLSFSPDS